MKNLLLCLTACSAFLLGSCSKQDYTCRCEGGISGSGTTFTIQKPNMKKAKKECESHSQPDTNDGFTGCRLQ